MKLRPQMTSIVCAVLLALSGCRVTDVPLWTKAGARECDACAVEKISDVAYVSGPEAKNFRHWLDIYIPKGKSDFPVVILYHGGAWVMGDNRCCGLYSSVGEFLASQGIGVVMPNYRLSPDVQHPEHAKDAARALAWTKAHIQEYGGRADQIFLVGHSAGGHIVALLAADESYLKAERLRTEDIRGVIALSGVYEIPSGAMTGTLGGAGPLALHWNSVIPLRGDNLADGPCLLPGIPMTLNIFGPMFGDDATGRAEASPITHVRAGLPPMLILSAEKDLPTLGTMALDFHKALIDHKCEAQFLRVERRNHNSIMFNATTLDDPAARAIVTFIRRHAVDN